MESMKDRSPVICARIHTILLVARARSRWSLPGGTIRRPESTQDAALRELEEETSLVGMELTYVFQFGGLSTRHHVFRADVPQDAAPEARNEISRCRWFSPAKISTLVASIPTREIVDLFCTHANWAETPPAVIGKPDGSIKGVAQLYTQVADTVWAEAEHLHLLGSRLSATIISLV